MPNVRMPDGVVVRFPETMSADDIRNVITSKFSEEELSNPNLLKGNEFTRGVKRGVATTAPLVTEGIPALTKSLANKALNFVGKDDVFVPESDLREYMSKVEQAQQKYPTKYPTYKDVTDLSSLGGYVAAGVGETAPQLAYSIASGGMAGLLGKTAIKGMAKRAGRQLTEKEASDAFNRSLLMGTGISSGSLNIPESYFNLLEKGSDDPLAAMAVGGLKTGLDAMSASVMLQPIRKLLGPQTSDVLGDSIVKNISKGAVKGAKTEFVTEGAQTILDDIATQIVVKPNEGLFTPENIDNWIESSLKGSMGGFVGGGFGGAFEPTVKKDKAPETFESLKDKLKPKQRQKVEAKFEEEIIKSPILVDKDSINSDSVLPPVYHSPEVNKLLTEYGINHESTAGVFDINFGELLTEKQKDKKFKEQFPNADLEQAKADAAAMQTDDLTTDDSFIGILSSATTLSDIHNSLNTPLVLPSKKSRNKKVQEGLIVRNKDIKEGKRTDAIYIPGDGEIVFNPKEERISSTTPTKNTLRKIKVDDTYKINNKVIEAKLQRYTDTDSISTLQKKLGVNDHRLDLEKLPKLVALKFYELGDTQRGFPEIQMTKTQGVLGGGVMSSAIEHIGDISNRMSAHQFIDHGFDMVAPKIRNMLKLLTNSYGFEKEFKENLKNNSEYRKTDLQSFTNTVKESLLKYSNEHSKLPVYNKAQFDAREAAVALGQGDYDKVITHLKNLNEIIKDKETYIKAVTEYKLDNNFNLIPFDKTETKFQRLSPTADGNLEDAVIIPTVQANNLELVELTPAAKKQYSNIITQLERILKEVAGDKIEFKPLASIKDSITGDTGLGVQFMNTVAVALAPNTTRDSQMESMFHEVYHFFKQRGLINSTFADTADLVKYYEQDSYLRDFPFEILLSDEIGREELEANAFGKWALEQWKLGSKSQYNVPKIIPKIFHKAWKDIMNYIRKVKNMLNGNNFTKFEDIFADIYTGQKAKELYDNVTYLNKYARLQRISDAAKAIHVEGFKDDFGTFAEEAKRKSNEIWDKGGQIGAWSQFFQSFQWAGSEEPLTALAFSLFQEKHNNFLKLLNKYRDVMPNFQAADRAVRYGLHEIMDYCRNTEQKAKLDSEGFLTYIRDNQVVRLKDQKTSALYIELQNAYSEVLNDAERALKEALFNHYRDLLKSPDFAIKDLNALIDKYKASKNEATVDKLEAVKEKLADLNKMRAYDYVPRMRYGSWGIKVEDRETKELVDLFTVEDGGVLQNMSLDKIKNRYNEFQLKEVLDTIKEKYDDSSKYRIVGGNGEITDFNSIATLIPFKMNYNDLKKDLDPRFVNIETLSSLLHSTNIDPTSFDKLRNDLYNDVLVRGFNTRFIKSDNVGVGYSRDWDRASHSYFSGAARFFSGVPHSANLAKLKVEIGKSADDKLKAKLTKYIDYTDSVQEDMQSLRSFNFFWTMGGNISTALVQMITIPTITNSYMNMYNPNLLENSKYLAKWSTIGAKHFLPTIKKRILSADGHATVNFGDKDAIEAAMKEGMSEQNATYLLKEIHRMRGQAVEDFVGFEPFETRSLGGQIKKKMSKAGYYLGLPIGVMEQYTRFISNMALYDMLSNNPQALAKAKEHHGNDYRYQAMKFNRPTYSEAEVLASFTMDNAHASFGKYGRAPYMRGFGGLFFPFTLYTHTMLEGLVKMYSYGPDGRRALMLSLGSMFIIGGLMGLPGAELLKELLEELQKHTTGVEQDYDLLIREMIYKQTGSDTAAKFFTQGFGRAFGGVELSRRTGLPVPGTDLILMLTGAKEAPTSDVFGVAGGILPSLGEGFRAFNEGDFSNVLAAITPVAGSNLVKAANMMTEGVKTKSGYQLLTPEEVTATTAALKAIGFTSDQVASAREELFYGKILNNRKYTTGVEGFRNKAKKHYTDFKRHKKNGNQEKASQAFGEYREVLHDYVEFARDNKIPADMPSFVRSIIQTGQQRTTGKMNYKDLRTHARVKYRDVQKILGTREKEQ